jgi:hypothetical protein
MERAKADIEEEQPRQAEWRRQAEAHETRMQRILAQLIAEMKETIRL